MGSKVLNVAVTDTAQEARVRPVEVMGLALKEANSLPDCATMFRVYNVPAD
jgi:hypothetical protein